MTIKTGTWRAGHRIRNLASAPERRNRGPRPGRRRASRQFFPFWCAVLLFAGALAEPAAACLPPQQRTAEQQLAFDLSEQREAWDRSGVVYLGVVVEVSPSPPPANPGGAPVLTSPGEARLEIRVQADRVLKGRLPAGARSHVLSVRVGCVPSDLARSRPGDRLVIYTDASGPNDSSGAILASRIRDPATLNALGEVAGALTGDGNQDEAMSQEAAGPWSVESWMAVALHPDTSAVWGAAGHRSATSARQRVTAACAAVMGEGCVSGDAWTGDVSLAVALDGSGRPWAGRPGQSTAEAELAALAVCEDGGGAYGCRIALSFSNRPIPAEAGGEEDFTRDHFPKTRVQRHRWALLAWPSTPAEGPPPRVWLSTGRLGIGLARQELVDLCQAESGDPCRVGIEVPNGMVTQYATRLGRRSWLPVGGPTTPENEVEAACPDNEKPCRVLGVYDAESPRLLAINDG